MIGENKNQVTDKLNNFRYTVNKELTNYTGVKYKNVWRFDGFNIITEDNALFNKTDFRTQTNELETLTNKLWNGEIVNLWNFSGVMKWNGGN